MNDLISRQAAIRETWREPTYSDPLNVMTEMRDRIEALPSAQPEIKCIAKIMLTEEQVQEAFEKAKKEILAAQPEIVRCRECKHRFVDGENVRFNVCELNHNKVQSDDWFCADGERRSENERPN